MNQLFPMIMHMQPTRELVRPDNQLALSEAQLTEEIPRMLTANNPVATKNLARRVGHNWKERRSALQARCKGRVATGVYQVVCNPQITTVHHLACLRW